MYDEDGVILWWCLLDVDICMMLWLTMVLLRVVIYII